MSDDHTAFDAWAYEDVVFEEEALRSAARADQVSAPTGLSNKRRRDDAIV